MRTPRLLPLILAAAALSACGQPPSDKAGRLLSMAAEEAATIPNRLDRFTRQLNIADTQLMTGRKADAARSLALARDTLAGATAADFDDLHKIAGWTAVSQLARRAEDRDLAGQAADRAVAALNDVKPVAARPQYVLSLAAELAELRGKAAAVELLDSGCGWAAEIQDVGTRRYVLTTFAARLLDDEAYDIARNALRRDPDPAWRTDTFLVLATGAAAEAKRKEAAGASVVYDATPMREAASAARTQGAVAEEQSHATFHQEVRFESVFKRPGGYAPQ
jgi:hypothetical protein